MYHEAFLYTWGPSLINVIIVVLCTKSSFPPKKELYGLTVNNQSHLTPSRLSICLTCYLTLLTLLWPRLLPGGLLPPLFKPLGCGLCLAALHFKRLISLAIFILQKTNVNCSEIVK